MTMTGAAFNGRAAEIIGVGKSVYLSIPGMTPAGKYVKVTAADLADSKLGLGQMFNSADPQVRNMNPAAHKVWSRKRR